VAASAVSTGCLIEVPIKSSQKKQKVLAGFMSGNPVHSAFIWNVV
jgi:hypothetical protein